jgi:peroxiredoxin
MRKLFWFSTGVVLLVSSAFSQQWMTDRIASLPDINRIDSLTKSLCKEAEGKKVPSFTFRGLSDDSLHTLAEYAGRVTVVNFWGTTCSGCRLELPDLSRLHESYRDEGVSVVFLSSQSKKILTDFLASHPVSGVKGIVERSQLTEPYQMFAVPSSFLVDRTGIVREMWMGPRTFEQLEKAIQPYLTPAH